MKKSELIDIVAQTAEISKKAARIAIDKTIEEFLKVKWPVERSISVVSQKPKPRLGGVIAKVATKPTGVLKINAAQRLTDAAKFKATPKLAAAKPKALKAKSTIASNNKTGGGGPGKRIK